MGAAGAAAGLLLNPGSRWELQLLRQVLFFLAKKLSEDAVPAVNVFGD